MRHRQSLQALPDRGCGAQSGPPHARVVRNGNSARPAEGGGAVVGVFARSPSCPACHLPLPGCYQTIDNEFSVGAGRSATRAEGGRRLAPPLRKSRFFNGLLAAVETEVGGNKDVLVLRMSVEYVEC